MKIEAGHLKQESDLVLSEADPDAIEVDSSAENFEVGQWYWVVRDADDDDHGNDTSWLGCVMRIGSNHVEVQSPHFERGYHQMRVHFDRAHEVLRREADPEGVIAGYIKQYKDDASRLMGEVRAITARLGVQADRSLNGKSGAAGTSMAVLSGQTDVDGYKRALVQAHDHDLPALFEGIKEANENLAKWMAAETMPMLAMMNGMNGHLDTIKGRIFNVTLYAGLTEEVVQCADGAAADISEKLRVMQRRLYMDEECLLAYETGGMGFNDIGEFDKWLCVPENRDRILPFPRCMVAMRVRRSEKERAWDGSISSIFINFNLGKLDKLTFLYIRNGEQVYRLNCDLEFDEMIFPDKAMFNPGEPMMVEMFAGSVRKMITRSEYDERLAKENDRCRKSETWRAENPGAACWFDNPHERGFNDNIRSRDWVPFDDTSVYYDECVKSIDDKIKRYNRIALIIQGLFDRSPVLHPHPPVKSWTPEGFAAAIDLVYDGAAVLHNGPAPDFEAYRARCNDLIDKDSILYGQDEFWQRKEAEKESARLDADYRNKSEWRPKLHKPYGNPGPGELARMASWQPRASKAVFAWNRERQTEGDRWSGKRHGDPIRTTLTVPVDALFNVSAYMPGDFKQFFRDPRTRAEYLKWAPMLLSAEEYHAGNRKVRETPACDTMATNQPRRR